MAKYITEESEDFSIVDNHTGEIRALQITKKITLDEFIMVFFSSCPALLSLTGNHLKVLICCWKHSTYNPENEERGNIIHNSTGFKNACRESGLDVSNAVIDNAISALCRKGFLIKKFRGEYLLNPLYFFKGRLSSRSRINLNLSVDPSDQPEEVLLKQQTDK